MTFVVSAACIVCIRNLQVGRTPHDRRTGGRRAQARHAALDAIGEIGPGPGRATRCRTPGGRAGRRHLPNPFGASPPFRRGCHPPPERRPESDQERESRRRGRPDRPRPVAPRPDDGREATGGRTVEECSSRRPYPGRTPPAPGGGTPRAIARIKVRAIGSAVWLVRCFSRRGPQRIRTPALDRSRHLPRELVPGSSLPVRPSNVAGG